MRSDKIKVGPQAAPHRSLLYALGLTDEEIQKPLIGIVSSQNDIVPGHMNLDKIVDAVKQGVALAGGVPIVFPGYCRLRRYRNGTRRHEVFSRQP